MLGVSKFYNFLRNNKLAPISFKLKVMNACVCSALLHNCGTFSNKLPDDLKVTYISLIKSCLGVHKKITCDFRIKYAIFRVDYIFTPVEVL